MIFYQSMKYEMEDRRESQRFTQRNANDTKPDREQRSWKEKQQSWEEEME